MTAAELSDLPQKCVYEAVASEAVVLQEAGRFLSALAPNATLTFQTLNVNKLSIEADPNSAWRFNRTLHGSLAEHGAKLTRLNNKGACVFVMANQGDGRGRKAENVMGVRSVFVDLDGAPLEPVLASPIPPSIVVESSPGRFHAYWLVRNMPVRDFNSAQKALAARFDGDNKVCDPPRLMRVPGFVHRKSQQPFVSRLITCEPDLIWDWPILADALTLPRSMALAERIPEGERNSTLYKLAVVSRKQGTAKDERLRSLQTLNAARCDPPLSEVEVAGIVDRAYRTAPEGKLEIPLSLLSNPKFVGLGVGPKLLLLLSYQRLMGRRDTEFALLWNDFKQHFRRERTFGDFRARIVDAGLLKIVRRPTSPRGVVKPQPALYKLTNVGGV